MHGNWVSLREPACRERLRPTAAIEVFDCYFMVISLQRRFCIMHMIGSERLHGPRRGRKVVIHLSNKSTKANVVKLNTKCCAGKQGSPERTIGDAPVAISIREPPRPKVRAQKTTCRRMATFRSLPPHFIESGVTLGPVSGVLPSEVNT